VPERWKADVRFVNVQTASLSPEKALEFAAAPYETKPSMIFIPDLSKPHYENCDKLLATLTPTFSVWQLQIDDVTAPSSSFLGLADEVAKFVCSTNEDVVLMGEGASFSSRSSRSVSISVGDQPLLVFICRPFTAVHSL
jgi:hypothetical protein